MTRWTNWLANRGTDPRVSAALALGLGAMSGVVSFYAAILLLPLLLLAFLAGGVWRRKGRVPLALNVVGGVSLAALVISSLVFIEQTRVVRHAMTWEIDSSGPGGSCPQGMPLVHLRFVDFPEFHVGEVSSELSEFLRQRDQEIISVSFEVTYDFYQVRGFHIEQVEGHRLVRTKAYSSEIETCPAGAGVKTRGGHPKKSPYDWPD